MQGLSGVVDLAAGQLHSLALKGDGTVWGWGANGYGQAAGDGTLSSKLLPTMVPSFSGMTAIAVGGYHSLALKSNGTVWAWGENNSGQLGDGTFAYRATPIQVPGLSSIVAIACGYNSSYAVTAGGQVYAWGFNFNGQLGDGSTTNRSTPVLVPGLSGITKVVAGGTFALAIDGTKAVYGWGKNSSGQLCDGTTLQRTSPVPTQITAAVNVQALAAGYEHAMAVLPGGSFLVWGSDAYGQLGTGRTLRVLTPIVLGSGLW